MKIKRLIIKNHPRINDCDRLLSGGVNLLPTECGEIISSLLNYSHLTDLLTSDDNPSDVFASIELENGNDSYKLQLNDGYYCYMKNDVVLSKEKAFGDECLSFFNSTNDKYYFFAGVRGEEKRPVRYYREELFNEYTGGKLLYKVINGKELYVSYNQERGYFFLKNASNSYEHAELSFCDEAVLSLWCFYTKQAFLDIIKSRLMAQALCHRFLSLIYFPCSTRTKADEKRFWSTYLIAKTKFFCLKTIFRTPHYII